MNHYPALTSKSVFRGLVGIALALFLLICMSVPTSALSTTQDFGAGGTHHIGQSISRSDTNPGGLSPGGTSKSSVSRSGTSQSSINPSSISSGNTNPGSMIPSGIVPGDMIPGGAIPSGNGTAGTGSGSASSAPSGTFQSSGSSCEDRAFENPGKINENCTVIRSTTHFSSGRSHNGHGTP